MAKRIGKYKVSNREAELSAVDGATISGNLVGISDLTANGTVTIGDTATDSHTVNGTLNQVAGASGTAGIQRKFASSTVGVHEYYEEVTLTTSDNNDVSVSLSKKLQAGCVILQSALTVVEIATSAHGDVALEVHSAAVADDAASAGTEIVGADVASNVSVPDANLNASDDGVVGEAVVTNTAFDRGTDATFFHVCTKEDCSSMTGTPKVGVYVKWIGLPAVTI